LCILIYKEQDYSVLKKKVYKRCFVSNPDGAGYAWWDTDKQTWSVRKGFMTFRSFWKSFNTDAFARDFKSTAVITHFRVGTSGNRKGPDCTHPFIISRDYEGMRELEFDSEHIAFHNGVIGPGKGKNSDTMMGVFEYIAPLMPHLKEEGIEEILEELLMTNKCKWLITNKEITHFYGKWIKDKEYPGYDFSNSSYEPVKVKVYTPAKDSKQGAGKWSKTGPIKVFRAGKADDFYGLDNTWSWEKWDEGPFNPTNTKPLPGYTDGGTKIISPNDIVGYFHAPAVAVGLVDDNGDIQWEEDYSTSDDMMCCVSCGSSDVETEAGSDVACCEKCGAVFSTEDGTIMMYDTGSTKRYCETCMRNVLIDETGRCEACNSILDYTMYGQSWGVLHGY
jgi:hypothetical protein